MLGIFNILKPTGLSSSDVVVKVRGILKHHYGEKIKVGHLGTLDPGGSGVLPIVFGKATRLFDYCLKDKKLYRAKFVFGKTTDTLDSYGNVVNQNIKAVTMRDIESILPNFIGEISQVPPLYSAVSVGGIRGYQAGRAGVEIEIPERKVSIFDIKILDFKDNSVVLDIFCGGGTYIRSICRDMAQLLGTVGYMAYIIRLENKSFKIENSITLDNLRENVEDNIISIENFLPDMERVNLPNELAENLLNGRESVTDTISDKDFLAYHNSKLIGICSTKDGKIDIKIRLWE